MSKERYTLVNPYLKGEVKKTYSGKTLCSRNKRYKTVSKYFNNSVSKFNFSIQKNNLKLER